MRLILSSLPLDDLVRKVTLTLFQNNVVTSLTLPVKGLPRFIPNHVKITLHLLTLIANDVGRTVTDNNHRR